MNRDHQGTALITGASTGIGAVYAERLADRGYDLILVARDAGRMKELAARLRNDTGRTVEVLPADLTDPEQLAVVEARVSDDPSLRLLVNNAGAAMDGTLLNTSPAEAMRLISLNITAPTLLAGAAAKAFVARKTGAIVNLASVLALAPETFDGVYSGAKAFIINLSLSLATEIMPEGVHVQVVLPGATRTEAWARSGKDIDMLPPELIMEAGDLVDAALLGLDRRELVTIPSLADEQQWIAFEAARLAMGPNLSSRYVAARYRENESV